MGAKSLSFKENKFLTNDYSQFEKLNGFHPWMTSVSEGFVTYKVRELNTGKIVYFNYTLAKEMGLISAEHPHRLTEELENIIIKTFSIQIINEYDEVNNKRIPQKSIKPHRYMATRYLQLQHANKQGKTSGDGRGIWNGHINHKGSLWDVSSRGTGVTCLAPGAVEANKPLKTGSTEYGYGCGLAEIDELLAAAILAETMHLQGIETERVLCIVDHGNGHGIGVRAAKNLIRPAHLFLFLKQNKMNQLKAATDYLIDRQIKNKKWKITAKDSEKYFQMCEIINYSFAKFAAYLDVDYIFAWLDWDGDNVLADAGIIDYGSIRQFGIRHDKYRYDDVQRFSTNLNEQKNKAKLIVQVFIQLADYLTSGTKKPIKNFVNHPILKKFNDIFEKESELRLLYKLGLNANQRDLIYKNHKSLADAFIKEFKYFESAKISGHMKKVADGVNHPALFNMKSFLRFSTAQFIKIKFDQTALNEKLLHRYYSVMLSKYATKKEKRIGQKQKERLNQLISYHHQILNESFKGHFQFYLEDLNFRVKKINNLHQLTGNALVEIVNYIIEEKKKRLPFGGIQKIIDRLTYESLQIPEARMSVHHRSADPGSYVQTDIFREIQQLRVVHKEDI